MKKVLLVGATALLLTTGAYAQEVKCSTSCEKLGFAIIGAAQGFIIGGPIGAFWGLGTVAYAGAQEECDISEKTKIVENKKPITKIEKPKEKKKTIVKNELTTETMYSAVKFKKGSSKVIKKMIPDYDRLNLVMSTTDNIKSIEIVGSACKIGNEEDNYNLGLDRAYAVKKYLKDNYRLDSRIKFNIKSVGELKPVSSVLSENRKVDITVNR